MQLHATSVVVGCGIGVLLLAYIIREQLITIVFVQFAREQRIVSLHAGGTTTTAAGAATTTTTTTILGGNNISNSNNTIITHARPGIVEEEGISSPSSFSSPPRVVPAAIYGFVHIAKTSGTNINAFLALKYERVCGQNGNSFMAYQENELLRSIPEYDKLTLEQIQKQYYRGDAVVYKPNIQLEQTIGFEDCDWIGVEAPPTFWMDNNALAFLNHTNTNTQTNMATTTETTTTTTTNESETEKQTGSETKTTTAATKDNTHIYPKPAMELHVPCREPIDHLMLQCKSVNKHFYCNAGGNRKNNTNRDFIKKQINKCLMPEVYSRFTKQLELYVNNTAETANSTARIDLKCFDAQYAFPNYVEYVGKHLQQRRIQGEYLPRHTVKPRQKEEECIWQPSRHDVPDLPGTVREILRKDVHYYDFCHRCIGSKNDLFA